MEILIFIFYLVVFSILISTISFFKNSQIGRWTLIILFVIKILAGFAYAKFYTLPKYYPGSDTWRFYRSSLDETKVFLHNPVLFFKDLFISGYSQRGNIFSGQNTYWNDLKSNAIVKLMAIINCLTNSSYYSNIIYFNFLFLFGLVGLFKVFYKIFPGEKPFIIIGLFLLPSALFWCSGIHKDGLILSAVGIIIYIFNKGLEESFSLKKVLIILFCFLILFTLRNYILFALFPALLSWVLCKKYKGQNFKIFSIVYLTGFVLILLLPKIFPSANILSYIAEKQQEFLLLEGDSKVATPHLQPTFASFISFIPNALDMAFIRPHLGEIKSIVFIPLFLENLLLLSLFLIAVIQLAKENQSKPGLIFLFFFSISILLLSGYTIPFVGAIVRYKSFILPLAITPLLCISVNYFNNIRIKVEKRGNS